jgi:small subunit ribosomal protein S16
MATKIRLQRHGKKGKPFYHIVVTDSRARRDGKYIERIGFYNPTTIPASIDLDVNRALHWVQVGAEPTDTAHAILKYKGVLYKNHLMKGVAKGAFSIEVAEKMFEEWVANKQTEIDHKRTKHKEEKASQAAALATAGREAAIAKKQAKEAALAKEAAGAEEEGAEEEGIEEVAVSEEAVETIEESTPETIEEASAKEAAPEVEEVVAEAPVEEAEVTASAEEETAENAEETPAEAAPEEVIEEAQAEAAATDTEETEDQPKGE